MTFEEACAMVEGSLQSVLRKKEQFCDDKVVREVNRMASGPSDNHVGCEAQVLRGQLHLLREAKEKGTVSTVEELVQFLEQMKKAEQILPYGMKVGLHLLSATIEERSFGIGGDTKREIDALLIQINDSKLTLGMSI